jgi:hypothetical protein
MPPTLVAPIGGIAVWADPAAPVPFDMSGWNRRVVEMYRYWESCRPPGGGLPGRQHIDPLAIPHLLPQLSLVDVVRNPIRLRYRLVGTRIDQMYGHPLTGRWMGEAHPRAIVEGAGFARYIRAAETGQASWRRGRPLFWYDKVAEIENVVLPLARDGSGVDMLLIHTRFYASDGTEL